MTKRKISPEKAERLETKNFFDCVLPGIVKFNVDHYIVGDGYRSVWAVREYPPLTEQQAILARIADKNGVTLRVYHRLVEATEQRKIIQNATRKNKMKSTADDMTDSVEAEGNLQDVIDLFSFTVLFTFLILHSVLFQTTRKCKAAIVRTAPCYRRRNLRPLPNRKTYPSLSFPKPYFFDISTL